MPAAMKTYLTYGFYMAIGSALVIFALYFLGYHEDAAKLGTAQLVQSITGLAIGITCVVLGTKERRAAVPPTEDFGYGRALGAAFMIVLFASLMGVAFNLVYTTVINPGFTEVVLRSQADKLEAQGLSSDKVEQITTMTRKMMHPAVQSAMGFLAGLFFGTLVALVTAAFLKRPATDELVAT